MIYPQDVVTSCPYQSALSHLRPRLYAPEFPSLPEMVGDVHQPELHENIGYLLTARVLGSSNVGMEVPYHYGT